MSADERLSRTIQDAAAPLALVLADVNSNHHHFVMVRYYTHRVEVSTPAFEYLPASLRSALERRFEEAGWGFEAPISKPNRFYLDHPSALSRDGFTPPRGDLR